MFAKDRDLYVLEPGLHKDVAWLGQKRISTIGSIVGTTLTINTQSFTDAQVEAGSVVIFDGVVVEVVSVESATQATVSMMRGNLSSAAIPGVEANSRGTAVFDYSAQRAMVHRQVLVMLGLDPEADGFDESVITNPSGLVRLEALGTLHLIYASAGAPGRAGEKFHQRAEMYKERYMSERERVVAMIDLDGDGIADVSRRPNAMMLSRA